MANVFLSHSSTDDRYVGQVHAFLKAVVDASVFNDVVSIPAGAEFWKEIERGIHACERLVIIVSRDAMESPWVQKEVALARELEKPVIPVRIDDCDVKALFDGINVLDFRPNRGHKLHFNTKSLPATYTGKLYGRDTELAQLFDDLADPQVRIVAFDAMGGTGKTALIYHFVQKLKTQGWGKLESVFIWSFYSQGSSEDKQTHAADFFRAAFTHFHPDGKKAELPTDPREQGSELARLIADQATLLVLDGLEPLQYAASGHGGAYLFGGIKDPGVKTMLSLLAETGHPQGLTIVTTRIQLHELDGNASFRRHHLDQLPTEAAIELFRETGIEPTVPDPLPTLVRKEFVRAIEDLKHHALSLNLAARLVAEHHKGQIRAFAEVLPRLHDEADTGIDAKHRSPFRVMRALEAGLFRVLHNRLQRMSAAEAIDDSPAANQLCLLYFLGLFDRPASLEHLPVVYDASQDLRDAVPMLPEDKAEYLQKVAEAAAIRDAILQDPHSTDDARLEARHAFEDKFYDLSFHYWLPPVFARFDPRPESNNRKVTNALTQLSQQNLVSKARLNTGEGGHVEWETLPPKEWFTHHVDCHPLIREYFGHQLRKKYAEAFQAAHGRLYDWFRFEGLPEEFRDPVAYGMIAYKAAYPDGDLRERLEGVATGRRTRENSPNLPPSWFAASSDQLNEKLRTLQSAFHIPDRFLPTTEAGMIPLFAAIGHGCLAGRHDECFNEVYWPRVSRGNEHFVWKKLGLFGQNLAALASFFETPFRTPHPGLLPSDQALVLNLAGLALRGIGRLPDAVEPMRAAVDTYKRLGDDQECALNSGNLSELLLTLGHVERDEAGQPGALPTAARAVEFADQSGHGPEIVYQSANQLVNALLSAGRLVEAEKLINEAKLLSPTKFGLPFLIGTGSLAEFELLLISGRYTEAEALVCRVDSFYRSGRYHPSLLESAFVDLQKARAQSRLASSQPSTKNQEQETQPSFLNALLDANQEDHIPRGYLAQAEIRLEALGFRREVPESSSLKPLVSSLEEAETRARRGPMPLFLAEAWLLRSRLALLFGDRRPDIPVWPSSSAHDLWPDKNVRPTGIELARHCRDEAAKLIEKHGYGRRKPDLAVLNCEIDPSLENFQTACGHVGTEGWWELMPRLEALVAARPKGLFGPGERGKWDAILAPLRKAEKAYQAERDAYLSQQLAVDSRQQDDEAEEVDADALLAQLPAEIIQQIATQTGAPADWTQWPEEFKAAVVQAILKSQQEGE